MIPIQNFYTGENAGVVLPDTPKTERAIYNKMAQDQQYYRNQVEASDKILAEEQRKQKMFLDFTSVKPVQALVAKHQADQMMELQKFEGKAKELYDKRGGRLSTSDYMMLQNDRNKLLSWQQNLQANQELYKRDKAIVAQGGIKYDPDFWNQAEKEFMETHTWNSNLALTRNPSNITDMFRDILKNAPTSTGKKSWLTTVDGKEVQNEVFTKQYGFANVDQLKDFYRKESIVNYELMDSVAKQFAKDLTSSNTKVSAEAQGYLDKYDADKNKEYSESEQRNAIMEYGIDKYAPKDIEIASGEGSREQKPNSNLTFQFGLSGSSKDKKGQFEYADNLSTENLGEGESVAFTGDHKLRIPSKDLFFPEGYANNMNKLLDVTPVSVRNGKFEGKVDFPEKQYATKVVSEAESEQYKQRRDPTEEELKARPELEGNRIVTYTLPQKSVTVTADFPIVAGRFKADYNEKDLEEVLKKINMSLYPSSKKVKYIIPNVGSFTEDQLKANKWTDADIAKLKQE